MGTDALRFSLLVGSSPGNDMNLSVKKVEANRNFANKIWNAGRFVISAVGNRSSCKRRENDCLPRRWLDNREACRVGPQR